MCVPVLRTPQRQEEGRGTRCTASLNHSGAGSFWDVDFTGDGIPGLEAGAEAADSGGTVLVVVGLRQFALLYVGFLEKLTERFFFFSLQFCTNKPGSPAKFYAPHHTTCEVRTDPKKEKQRQTDYKVPATEP